MEEELFYDNIQRALENLPENVNILEEQIDIDTQMKYFEFTKKVRKKEIAEECFEKHEELYTDEVDDDRKKEILSAIAGLDKVAAFRVIERFLAHAGGEMKQWAVLAYQESRMMLQSYLLDEQQVYISTGLGGKGQSLRYFIVFINKNVNELLNETQRKLLKNELVFMVEKEKGAFEAIDFMEGFATAKVLLPITANIKQFFNKVVEECNEYGNFLSADIIITNVKVLSRGEILDLLEQKNREADDHGLEEE